MESSKNPIIVGDLNEDSLNSNYQNLKNVLIENSSHNIISESTRDRALLEPIIIPDDLTTLFGSLVVFRCGVPLFIVMLVIY